MCYTEFATPLDDVRSAECERVGGTDIRNHWRPSSVVPALREPTAVCHPSPPPLTHSRALPGVARLRRRPHRLFGLSFPFPRSLPVLSAASPLSLPTHVPFACPRAPCCLPAVPPLSLLSPRLPIALSLPSSAVSSASPRPLPSPSPASPSPLSHPFPPSSVGVPMVVKGHKRVVDCTELRQAAAASALAPAPASTAHPQHPDERLCRTI